MWASQIGAWTAAEEAGSPLPASSRLEREVRSIPSSTMLKNSILKIVGAL